MGEKMSQGDYRLPAEWEPHRATILCWPHQKEDWPGKFMPIPWVFAEIVRQIVQGELVRIIVQTERHKERAEGCLKRAGVDLGKIEFIQAQTDRGWMRDSSPAFVKQGAETVAVGFCFNGWAKYANCGLDQQVPAMLARNMGLRLLPAEVRGRPMVLEGGAIDSNGEGTLLTTEECLLDEQVQVRNPGLGKNDYEAAFQSYLGIDKTIWLGRGIAGDDTHGHVDDLCRFVKRDTVVLCQEQDPTDANYALLRENRERLHEARLADGTPLTIIDLPMPRPLIFDGLRLPASYANFYIANHAVLVPTFNDANDRVALTILQQLFPDRQVVGIHAVDLVWGLGTIHCLSHEVPL
jgi:agmatine deiminase